MDGLVSSPRERLELGIRFVVLHIVPVLLHLMPPLACCLATYCTRLLDAANSPKAVPNVKRDLASHDAERKEQKKRVGKKQTEGHLQGFHWLEQFTLPRGHQRNLGMQVSEMLVI